MKYLPKRKSTRLKNYNYSKSGMYFVTICTHDRNQIFGNIITVGATRRSPVSVTRRSPVSSGRDRPIHEMVLNNNGKIVKNIWKSLPDHHPVELDTFQIMPNHVHFILEIGSGGSRPAPTLGTIVGLFKSECTKRIRKLKNDPNIKIWQRNYLEHVIRQDDNLNKIRSYITNNPNIWHRDRNNPNNIDNLPKKTNSSRKEVPQSSALISA